MLRSTLLAHRVNWVDEGAHICGCERGTSIAVSHQGQDRAGDSVRLLAAGSMLRTRGISRRKPECVARIIESKMRC